MPEVTRTSIVVGHDGADGDWHRRIFGGDGKPKIGHYVYEDNKYNDAHKSDVNAPHVITHDWIKKGTWEHIIPGQPDLKISSKRELIDICKKHNCYPKAFMKPHSQRRGWDYKEKV